MTELKSCPFCGSKYLYIDDENRHENPNFAWEVYCSHCKAEMIGFRTRVAAVEAWNTRVGDEDAVGDLRDM